MIVIDGEYPKTCSDCPLWYYDEDGCSQYCVLTDKNVSDFSLICRSGDCPIKEGVEE